MSVKCPKCGNGLSPSAKNCPKCGAPANAAEYRRQYGPCRHCGALLERARHRQIHQSTYLRDGNTEYRHDVSHTPCPHCGDPKPLAGAADNPFIVWGVILCALLLLLCWLLSAIR